MRVKSVGKLWSTEICIRFILFSVFCFEKLENNAFGVFL
jgi:hypothetical protein